MSDCGLGDALAGDEGVDEGPGQAGGAVTMQGVGGKGRLGEGPLGRRGTARFEETREMG